MFFHRHNSMTAVYSIITLSLLLLVVPAIRADNSQTGSVADAPAPAPAYAHGNTAVANDNATPATPAAASASAAAAFTPPVPPPDKPPTSDITDQASRTFAPLVEQAEQTGMQIGVHVVHVGTGTVLYSHNGDALFNPASNAKIVTTAAALKHLGPAHTFTTRVFCDSAPQTGVIDGNLYLVGGGDPKLVTEDMWRLARQVSAKGVSVINGDLVADQSCFDDQTSPPAFDQKNEDSAFRAPVGCLSVSFNAVAVDVGPGEQVGDPARVNLDPPGDYLVLDNRAVTVGAGKRRELSVSSIPETGHTRVLVRGSIPLNSRDRKVYKRIEHPAMNAAHAFKALLAQNGVQLKGRVRVGVLLGRNGNSDATGQEIMQVAEHVSPPLWAIVADINKYSQNFMAESVLKGMGMDLSQNIQGTSDSGRTMVAEFLSSIGINRGAYVYKNGSGLYDANRFSARQLTGVLAHMAQDSGTFAEYISSMATAGLDGTIKSRMGQAPLKGLVRVKTGTLSGVTSLSGYWGDTPDETVAFAILMEDVRNMNKARSMQDQLVEAIANGTAPMLAAIRAADREGAGVGAVGNVGNVGNADGDGIRGGGGVSGVTGSRIDQASPEVITSPGGTGGEISNTTSHIND